jgi:hypothetical protein
LRGARKRKERGETNGCGRRRRWRRKEGGARVREFVRTAEGEEERKKERGQRVRCGSGQYRESRSFTKLNKLPPMLEAFTFSPETLAVQKTQSKKIK